MKRREHMGRRCLCGGALLWTITGLVMVQPLGCSDDECDPGAYPAAPADATSVVHVSCECPGDAPDGSVDNPYGSITEGIAAAPDGAAVLVAPGVCAENVTVNKNVAIVGSSDPTSPGQAAVTIAAPMPYAVTIPGGTVKLIGLHVQSALGVGVWVQDATAASIEGCRVEGTTQTADGKYGFGVLGVNTNITVSSSIVSGSVGPGVLLANTDGTIEDNSIDYNQGGGLRVELAPQEIAVSGNTFNGNANFGMGMFSAKGIIIVENKVFHTTMGSVSGDGMIVGTLSGDNTATSFHATNNEIGSSARLGMLLGGGVGGTIASNQISDNGQDDAAGFGGGIWLQEGAGSAEALIIDSNTIAGNSHIGIGVTDDASASITDNAVTGTVEGIASGEGGISIMHVGDGVGVFDGASATISGNSIASSWRAGIFTDGAVGSATQIDNNAIQDNDRAVILQNQDADPVSVGANDIANNVSSNDVETVANAYSVSTESVGSPSTSTTAPQ